MISRSRPPEQLIIGPPQKAAEKEPAGPWSTGGADGVAGITAFGVQRKHVTLPTDFRSSPENGHSRYGNRTARFAPKPTLLMGWGTGSVLCFRAFPEWCGCRGINVDSGRSPQ